MLKSSLKFALYAGVIMIVGGSISCIIYSKDFNMDTGEILGYTSMILALTSIFFGIRSYRNNRLGGKISYFQGVKVGLTISSIAGIIYSVYSCIFYKYLFPDFGEKYLQFYMEKIKNSGASQEVIAKQLADMQANMALYNNLFFQALISFATVFAVGLIITLISAAILKRKEPKTN